MSRILLTGAFGNVGANTLIHLSKQGHTIYAFDVENERNQKKASSLSKENRFTTIWGDLRDPASVKKALETAQPEAIIHVAAIIAPTAYVIPKIAREVNVDGTKILLDEAKALGNDPHFIFTSSYSVHGPRNPYRDPPPLTGDTPVNPHDNYGKQKVLGENMTQESGLPWTIIRLPAVMATDGDWGQGPEFLKFGMLLPLDRRQHAIDSRDAGLALANAVQNEKAIGRKFNVGGPESDCQLVARDFFALVTDARGISIPESAFRQADPMVDDSWYYEDFVDTTESQAVLNYQQHTFADHLAHIRKRAGFMRYVLRVLSPIIQRQIVKDSRYYGKPPEIDSATVWERVCESFDIPLDTE